MSAVSSIAGIVATPVTTWLADVTKKRTLFLGVLVSCSLKVRPGTDGLLKIPPGNIGISRYRLFMVCSNSRDNRDGHSPCTHSLSRQNCTGRRDLSHTRPLSHYILCLLCVVNYLVEYVSIALLSDARHARNREFGTIQQKTLVLETSIMGG